MSNVEAVREYRRVVDAAEGLRMATGLKEVVAEGVRTGELSAATAWDLSHDLANIEVLAGGELKALERRATRMRDMLVKSNLPLVWRVARRTLGARKTNVANLEEAVQEGAIGLVRAIEEFDETRGSFSTCAAYWIRHHVQNCMHKQVDFAKQRSACMPRPVVREVNKFRLQNGREPEAHEISFKGKSVTPEDWARWTEATYTTSVEDMLDEGPERNRGGQASSELLADTSDTPDAVIAGVHLQDRLVHILAEMSPRNRDMSQKLFLEGQSLTHVAEHYGLSVERVRELKGVLEKRLREALAA